MNGFDKIKNLFDRTAPPDDLPVAFLLSPADMDMLAQRLGPPGNAASMNGIRIAVVPMLKRSVTLHANGSTSALNIK